MIARRAFEDFMLREGGVVTRVEGCGDVNQVGIIGVDCAQAGVILGASSRAKPINNFPMRRGERQFAQLIQSLPCTRTRETVPPEIDLRAVNMHRNSVTCDRVLNRQCRFERLWYDPEHRARRSSEAPTTEKFGVWELP